MYFHLLVSIFFATFKGRQCLLDSEYDNASNLSPCPSAAVRVDAPSWSYFKIHLHTNFQDTPEAMAIVPRNISSILHLAILQCPKVNGALEPTRMLRTL